jgi:AcrR family transcriptional regulator
MRITAEKKRQTRQRIMEVAHNLFVDKGFEKTTTRDIVAAAGIAAGTLFNYFPTKEALAMTLLAEALDRTEAEFGGRLQGDEDLAEALFAHVAAGLRGLAPHRRYVGEVLETAMSPFGSNAVCEAAERVRLDHLEVVRQLLVSRCPEVSTGPSFIAIHLYWTLYLGVLAFWAKDESPNREDTLSVLDHSMRIFAESLTTHSPGQEEVIDEAENR